MEIINGKNNRAEKFPRNYHVMCPAPGALEVLAQIGDDPDVVEIVPRKEMAADISKYCSTVLRASDKFQLEAKDANACVDYWCYNTPVVPPPKMLSWPGETGLCYTRVPWLLEKGECPTWDGLFARMSNAAVFRSWIGSLFAPDSDIQQYVWLTGEGSDGKGSLNRFLRRIFGPAYCAKQPPGEGRRFWAHGLIGKRIAVFPDCDDTKFVRSGLFKSMTGGDPIPVESKGGMAYTVELNCKYLIISNERPDLSSAKSDLRRIIYCELEPRPKDAANDPEFEARLWAEGGAFLHSCLEAYAAQSVYLSMESDQEQILDWVEGNEDNYLEIFDNHFEINWIDSQNWLPGVQVQRCLKMHYKSQESQNKFLRWMERKFEVRKKTVRLKDETVSPHKEILTKRYKGLVYKNASKDMAVNAPPRLLRSINPRDL